MDGSLERERKLEYQDSVSSLAIWWKAIFLAPIWGIAVIPLAGAFALLFVNNSSLEFLSSPGWQICLGLTVAACFVYFLDDLKKRSITVNNKIISFGLRKFMLDKLVSVGVEYKQEQLMPKRIVFRFRDGNILRLRVSRLRNSEFESLLRFVETRLPSVHIDPVILTMIKCRRQAGKSFSDTGDVVELRYQSRFALNELRDVFSKTWEEWSRYGPVIVSVFMIPVWTIYITQLFISPALFVQISASAEKIDFSALLLAISRSMYEGLINLSRMDYSCVVQSAGHPLTVVLLLLLFFLVLFELLKVLKQPNRILLCSDSIQLWLRLGSFSVCLKTIEVEKIKSLSLFKPDEMSDPSSWFLRINQNDGKSHDLSLKALNPEEKTRMIKAVQRLAPKVPIEADLLENFVARQERSYTELWLQSLSSAPDRNNLDPLQPGQVLCQGRYEVIRCLGVGGQGTAYLCKDTNLLESHLSDLVVLKESIFPVYAESSIRMQALERFEKEASLLQRIDHQGIVSLRDYFLEDHRGYLVMEHVDGSTLKQLVESSGALSEKQVRELALQMCEILQYLHENSIVHRDFTPDNLILNKNGALKLIDFNVAQQLEAGTTGTIVGKQSYIPPEQFRGKASNQSDIYALGATLHFLISAEEPEPICQSSPLASGASCSQSLDELIKDCTALQLSKRIKTAADLKSCLLSRSELASAAQEIIASQEITGQEIKKDEPQSIFLKEEEFLIVEKVDG